MEVLLEGVLKEFLKKSYDWTNKLIFLCKYLALFVDFFFEAACGILSKLRREGMSSLSRKLLQAPWKSFLQASRGSFSKFLEGAFPSFWRKLF